jgi:hypothetical protein
VRQLQVVTAAQQRQMKQNDHVTAQSHQLWRARRQLPKLLSRDRGASARKELYCAAASQVKQMMHQSLQTPCEVAGCPAMAAVTVLETAQRWTGETLGSAAQQAAATTTVLDSVANQSLLYWVKSLLETVWLAEQIVVSLQLSIEAGQHHETQIFSGAAATRAGRASLNPWGVEKPQVLVMMQVMSKLRWLGSPILFETWAVKQASG